MGVECARAADVANAEIDEFREGERQSKSKTERNECKAMSRIGEQG